MAQEKLYRVFRCYNDYDDQFDVGYYSSSEDPKNILIKSVIETKVKWLFDRKDFLLESRKNT